MDTIIVIISFDVVLPICAILLGVCFERWALKRSFRKQAWEYERADHMRFIGKCLSPDVDNRWVKLE